MKAHVIVCCLLYAATIANATLTNSKVRDASDDLITDLPGLDGITLNFDQYSGYLDAGNGIMLHYWFTESQSNPQEDPFLLWLNGGPGCSSLDGLLTELGPFHVNEDGETLYINEYSWNTFANVLFVESPACVGFSYSTADDCTASDDGTATANFNALVDFFARFPEFLVNDFYATGESYGGVYIPTLSQKIVESQDILPINIKGFATGNGLLNYEFQDNSLMFFGNYHGILGQTLWDNLTANCCENGVQSEDTCPFVTSTDFTCNLEYITAEILMYNTGLNIYGLYNECEYPPSDSSAKPAFGRYQAESLHLHLNRQKSKDGPSSRFDPPCIDTSQTANYLNSAAVRAALHIPDTVQDWTLCSSQVSDEYERQYFSMAETFQQLSAAGLRGLVYTGDTDMVCNFIGNQWLVESLGYEVTEAYRPWYIGNQVGGFVKRFELLDLLTIRGSGHMVPEDKPAEALQMIRAFVLGGSY